MPNTTKPNTTSCLSYSIYDAPLENLPSHPRLLISTLNQYSFCIGEKDNLFKKALLKSDVLLPDGIGIVLAAKFLKGKTIKKIAGSDLHDFQLNRLNEKGGSCFYLGASESTLEKIKKRVAIDYPNIKVGSHSPPFKPVFSNEDTSAMTKAVNAFGPDVLFIGMTAPKQEIWSYENKSNLNTGMICSVGAVFDFYAGTVKRPSKIWINLGLEWLGRLIKEPKRMWKRYIYYGFVFIYYLFRAKRLRIIGK